MKVLISNKAWLPIAQMRDTDVFVLKKKLIVVPKDSGYGEPPDPISCYEVKDGLLGLPRFFYEQNRSGEHEEEVRVSAGFKVAYSKIKLREEDQEPEISKMCYLLETKRKERGFAGGFFEAYTGYGKSVSAIEMIRRLGMTALVLVHKEPLMKQWVEEIAKFCPDAKVGTIQGKTCDYVGKDIVIGMIQSLMSDGSDKYPPDIFVSFGTVLVDESHRASAACFSTVVPKFNPTYTIGVTGTLRRKDETEDILFWNIGPKLVRATEQNRLIPNVYVRETGFKPLRKETVRNGTVSVFDMDKFPKSTQVNFLAKSDFRNQLIAKEVVKAVKAGRNPLVSAERLGILERIAYFVEIFAQKELGKKVTSGMYIGGKTEEALKVAAASDIVYATVQLAQEGINIPKLDTLFMATPMVDIEQLAGRICRSVPNKKQPLIIDFLDGGFSIFKGMFGARLKMYNKLGWKVVKSN